MQVLTIIFTLLLLSSCGDKVNKSSAQFSINISALSGSGASATGGMLLAGGRIDDSASFSKAFNVNDPDPIIELDNGKWHFYLVTWDGATNLSGTTKCAYSGVKDLTGEDTVISFALTTSFCSEAIPSADADRPSEINYTSGSWPTVLFSSVLDLANASGTGLSNSYRANVAVEVKGINFPGPYSAASPCKLMNESVVLPSGSSIGEDTIFHTTVEFYETGDCSGPSVKYFFKNGVIENLNFGPYQSVYTAGISGNSGALNVQIEHNLNTPNSSATTALAAISKYGTGMDGTPTIANGQTVNLYEVITSYDLVNNLITTSAAISLAVNDEIMWYVSEGSSCGQFNPGEYGFQRIKSAINANNYSLYGSIGDPTLSYPPSYSTGCRIQIIKVMNYENLTLAANQKITADPYNFSTGGGIVALRVRDTLTFDGGYIYTSTHGFNDFSPQTNGYSNCSSANSCLRLGSGNGANRGSGAVYIAANNIDIKNVASSSIRVSSFTSQEGKTGTIIMNANNLYSSAPGVTVTNGFFEANAPIFSINNTMNLTLSAPSAVTTQTIYQSNTAGNAIFSIDGAPAGTTPISLGDFIYYEIGIWKLNPPYLFTKRSDKIEVNYCNLNSNLNSAGNNILFTDDYGTNETPEITVRAHNYLCL